LLAVAVAAIDGAVASGLERDLGIDAALRAYRRVHLAFGAVSVTPLLTLRPAGLAARRAALGIRVTSFLMVSLVVGTENE
jgi:hypothetical protein